MNVVVTGSGDFVEVQGTAESRPFTRTQLALLTDLAARGAAEIGEYQRALLRAQGVSL
jgi:ribonuclease PH